MSDLLKLENQLCHRFYRISNAFTRAYRPLLEALNLTYPQYLVMLALWEEDNIAVSIILSRTQIDGGALSLILKKLSDKTLIRISSSKDDARKRMVSLTDAGAALKSQAVSVPKEMRCNIKSLEKHELVQLRTLLDTLADDLAYIGDKK